MTLHLLGHNPPLYHQVTFSLIPISTIVSYHQYGHLDLEYAHMTEFLYYFVCSARQSSFVALYFCAIRLFLFCLAKIWGFSGEWNSESALAVA